MGSWGPGPFDNDDAADFVGEAADAPARAVTDALRAVAKAPVDEYLDVDVCSAAWAACEVVAMAFGYGPDGRVDPAATELAARLRPKEAQRALALTALPRLADGTTSELAGLWRDTDDGGAGLAANLDDLRERLEAAAQGPRAVAKPEAGDVVVLDGEAGLAVIQVVGAREVAVFTGACSDDADALARVATGEARRVACDAGALLRGGRLAGRRALRKELKGRKLYATEVGAIDGYLLWQASGAGMRDATFEEARAFDALEQHTLEMVRAVALEGRRAARVRDPDQREAALRALHHERWAQRRAETTPGPFGDVAQLTRLVEWVEQFGVANAVTQHVAIARQQSGYGRPSEDPERRSYAFAAIVAVWLGRWPEETWPAALAGRLPPRPGKKALAEAHGAAKVLAEGVLTRDAELRLIWTGAPDGGAELAAAVASLKGALALS